MTLKDFNPVYGNDVIKKLDEGGQNPLQGIRKVVSSYGAEIIPTIFARQFLVDWFLGRLMKR